MPIELEDYLCRITKILHKALTSIVKDYFNNEEIQKIIHLPPRIFEILKRVKDPETYDIGSWRPDFLIKFRNKKEEQS